MVHQAKEAKRDTEERKLLTLFCLEGTVVASCLTFSSAVPATPLDQKVAEIRKPWFLD